MTKARDLANASTALSAVDATELGYLNGVTSAVQTQLDAKQAANANVSTTELGYLDGVTSAIQTQLNAKAEYPSQTGNSGKYLTTNGTATSWGTVASAPDVMAGKNFIINGSMDIAQRGTTFNSVSTVYTLDRWFFQPYGTATSANISQGSSDSVEGFRYYAKVAANTSSTSNFNFSQTIETANTVPLRGKTVTVSFYLRTPVAFSNVFTWNLRYSTSVDTRIENAGSGTAVGSDVVMTPTSTWTRYSQTFTIPTNASSLGFVIGTYNNTVATANFDITGVQLEIGSVATPFSRAGGTIQGELAACQRYYERTNWDAATGYATFGQGAAQTTTNARTLVPFQVQKRVRPTAIDYPTVSTNFRVLDFADNVIGAPSAVAFDGNQTSTSVGYLNWTTSGATVNRPYLVTGNNTASAYLGWSAEL